jgi:hypothetical protein
MISELNDDEILDFLMTSDFIGDYKPEELKYLLQKLRYFYKNIYLRHQNLKDDSEFKIKQLLEEVFDKKNKIAELSSIVVQKDNKIDSFNRRRLSFRERLLGKIIDENEN